MNMTDDVREAINEILYHADDVTILPTIPIKLGDALSTLRNWLDSQPTAPEPDWAQAPDRVVAWTVDAWGGAYWHTREPKIEPRSAIWTNALEMDGGTIFDKIVDLPPGIDWRETKRHRPQEDKEDGIS